MDSSNEIEVIKNFVNSLNLNDVEDIKSYIKMSVYLHGKVQEKMAIHQQLEAETMKIFEERNRLKIESVRRANEMFLKEKHVESPGQKDFKKKLAVSLLQQIFPEGEEKQEEKLNRIEIVHDGGFQVEVPSYDGVLLKLRFNSSSTLVGIFKSDNMEPLPSSEINLLTRSLESRSEELLGVSRLIEIINEFSSRIK